MPIKLPKGFKAGRRKSSGNILEDVETQPQSSFRVIERPGPHRSMTDGGPLTKRMSEGNIVPAMLEDDNMFAETEQPVAKNRYEEPPPPRASLRKRLRLTGQRPSGATAYESSTSTRLSSSSTQPSSTEVPPADDPSPHSRIHDVPSVPTPLSGALRAAGKTFSFTSRFKSPMPPASPRNATPDESTRQRAMTNSTDETATPPRLAEVALDLGSSQDDFGKMFDNMGKRESALLRERSPQRADQVLCPGRKRKPCKGGHFSLTII